MLCYNKGIDVSKEKISTADIKLYIDNVKLEAKSKGQEYIILVARDINNRLGLKSKYPMVCNAMRQSMSAKDEIIFSPASGYSSTLEIKYFI